MLKVILSAMAEASIALGAPNQALAHSPQCDSQRIEQLRIYEIFEFNKQAFHARFRDHASRIMRRYGFHVIAMWETRHGNRTEFVYLLRWPSEAVLKDRWAAFMKDEEWSRIKKETAATHGTLVGEIEDRIMTKTDYSPC